MAKRRRRTRWKEPDLFPASFVATAVILLLIVAVGLVYAEWYFPAGLFLFVSGMIGGFKADSRVARMMREDGVSRKARFLPGIQVFYAIKTLKTSKDALMLVLVIVLCALIAVLGICMALYGMAEGMFRRP